ncbi:MAG: hypothetical protein UX44_C0014G0009 [candidate division WWE3 bacterium GW2011_GWA1_46_21]|uniref:Uncharacterized protein n=4 Tax=Katanobacteria TaxID=422282 RepID=A0A0G1PD62_UNCKA|nr:MAG: hypothetical protein UX44_C0014G0009 [candidate division WWE3 bacterium GW2011_GWA1_46_21]KKU49371.1 MAG: hypothetical protein UX69_C0003G0023 [candidate division WWE3 bacterium GW2011_GWA2_46_9]KKU51271.1 MAG: hypothetical protein UX73_C0004G0017 [candidate division WWE3 bacterium GW2011_GWC1_47_10]KKU57938.1 MAG: hypothetical protein UX79_C0003G0008 [candidate division WWE3 bacterium GW2011_GWB1_47_11]
MWLKRDDRYHKKSTAVNKNIRKLIKYLFELDQHAFIYKNSNEKLFKLINSNISSIIKEIVDQCGYPNKNREFDILIQHCNDLDFSERCLKKYRNLINKDMVPYMIDSIAVNKGKKQIYGTIIETEKRSGKYITKPLPIRDKKNLDERRRRYGLEPLAVYLEKSQGIFVKVMDGKKASSLIE